MNMIINEKTKLLGFERKMRQLKKTHKKARRNTSVPRYTNTELLEYAASRLKSMGLKNVEE